MHIRPALPLLLALTVPAPSPRRQATYEVQAVRYATLPGFPVRGLVAGADSARRMDIAMMVWVLRGEGRVVLVDAGFYREKFVTRWNPTGFTQPGAALAPLGIRPEDVTDLVVTHVHWDHLDGADLFPRARLWIQRDEYEHHVAEDGSVRDRAIDPDDAAMLARLRAAGRVELVDGDQREILPGITVYTGGRHTWASQYVGVATASGTVVLASDNCYLYENVERDRPIAQTLDSLSNLAALARMKRLATDLRLVVPGHDPAVFERFPRPGHGIAAIE
jgi:glyoxylase-like metal-dependent hydrolase (beta-lactamase superfamily II)